MQQNDCNILTSFHLSLPIPGCDRLSPYPYHDQFALFPCHTLVTARLRFVRLAVLPISSPWIRSVSPVTRSRPGDAKSAAAAVCTP
jgi:hypothetical protein